ncbi:MAG: glycosyl transferase [Clostridiaceae bacterium]|nr:glycosyl transferase [Clostridiaceae bacterium]
MRFERIKARDKRITALDVLMNHFNSARFSGFTDAEWLSADSIFAVGATGLPFAAPICEKLMSDPDVLRLIESDNDTHYLFIFLNGSVSLITPDGEKSIDEIASLAIVDHYTRIVNSRGRIDENGDHVIDLKAYPVGSHYAVNLLIGDREGYPEPLYTTPKSAVDAFGAGSFRAGGATQVLATRYTLSPEENGEPVNRQFYLVENGRPIFYSADASNNVESACCRHGRNISEIFYRTNCGLSVSRTIFILPQEDGLPEAVEVQRVRVENRSGRKRNLRIVFTGMFSLCSPITTVNDVIFANIVHESEQIMLDGHPVALSLHSKPKNFADEKRFAMILSEGETMDDYCMNLTAFLGGRSLRDPALIARFPSRPERKCAPFFSMGKSFSIDPDQHRDFDSYIGMSTDPNKNDPDPALDEELWNLYRKFVEPGAVPDALKRLRTKQDVLSAYLRPVTEDPFFDTYIGSTLPFQVYYQTHVSRAFGWTQKAYRETGFREIQDIYASMYYMVAAGKAETVRELISMWVRNVFRAGYANHDFTRVGKEPGDCSDDPLWLVPAVYRYVTLTGDTDFLSEEYPVAENDGNRSVWDTLNAILVFCGNISVGAHGLPLLDKADWNDTLRLDNHCLKGPAKEAAYRRQLEETGERWGVPWENTLSESCMNACLLKIAADQVSALSGRIARETDGKAASDLSLRIRDTMYKYAWKGDYFARALINDGRDGGYTYLGAGGDGLSADPAIDGSYFLNSFSWSILADIADEEQIERMLEVVEKHLKTDAGLKLCTLIDFDLLGANTATAIYFPGDRENGGVFKHAAMMASVAALKAARAVKNESLAARLSSLAYFMIDKTLPYKTIETPFITKGNPRYCTQYNNSETGENIGPILSGTASWLTLAVFEAFGIRQEKDTITFSPVLREGQKSLTYRLNPDQDGTALTVDIESEKGSFRVGEESRFVLDGTSCTSVIRTPKDGSEHRIQIFL